MEIASEIGASVTGGLAYVGSLASLGAQAAYFTFVAPFRGKPLRWRRTISQAMDVGVRALPILSLISFFVGLILALQGAYELRKLGALNLIAQGVAITITRELGPLITAIVVIGRSGSAFAAELGTMRVTEEIDALETMAIDPYPLPGDSQVPGHDPDAPVSYHLGRFHGNIRRLGVWRRQADFTWASYFQATTDALLMRDIVTGLVKSIMFGITIQPWDAIKPSPTEAAPKKSGVPSRARPPVERPCSGIHGNRNAKHYA